RRLQSPRGGCADRHRRPEPDRVRPPAAPPAEDRQPAARLTGLPLSHVLAQRWPVHDRDDGALRIDDPVAHLPAERPRVRCARYGTVLVARRRAHGIGSTLRWPAVRPPWTGAYDHRRRFADRADLVALQHHRATNPGTAPSGTASAP